MAADWVWGDEHEIVSFVEIDPFCQKVLKKHWPETYIFDDIRDVTKEKLCEIENQNIHANMEMHHRNALENVEMNTPGNIVSEIIKSIESI